MKCVNPPNEGRNLSGMPEDCWHSRNYLPHCDGPNVIQMVTFGLVDALPDRAISKIVTRYDLNPNDPVERMWIEHRAQDLCAGRCWLSVPRIAELVQKALLHFDGDRYRMLAWVIMPNHVHTLFEPLVPWDLRPIVRSWKTFTGREANKLLRRKGPFWAREYHDRFIRNYTHYQKALHYIHDNPLKARLARRPWHYEWSSARMVPREPELRRLCAFDGDVGGE